MGRSLVKLINESTKLRESGAQSTYFVYLYFNVWTYYLEGFTLNFMNDLILPFEERCGYHLQHKLILYMNLNYVWPIKGRNCLVKVLLIIYLTFNLHSNLCGSPIF